MQTDDKETSGQQGQDQQGGSDSDKQQEKTYEVVFKKRDPKTGEDYDVTESKTVPELIDLAQGGYRWKELRGAQKVEIENRANELANQRAEAIIKARLEGRDEASAAFQKVIQSLEAKKEAESLKPPTLEEMQNDPKALEDWQKRYRASVEKTVTNMLEDERKKRKQEKADENEENQILRELESNTAKALEKFPKIPRSVLVAHVKANEVLPEYIVAEAEKLNEMLAPLSKAETADFKEAFERLPEDEREAFIKEQTEKMANPKAGPKGSTKEKGKTVYTSFDDLRKGEGIE